MNSNHSGLPAVLTNPNQVSFENMSQNSIIVAAQIINQQRQQQQNRIHQQQQFGNNSEPVAELSYEQYQTMVKTLNQLSSLGSNIGIENNISSLNNITSINNINCPINLQSYNLDIQKQFQQSIIPNSHQLAASTFHQLPTEMQAQYALNFGLNLPQLCTNTNFGQQPTFMDLGIRDNVIAPLVAQNVITSQMLLPAQTISSPIQNTLIPPPTKQIPNIPNNHILAHDIMKQQNELISHSQALTSSAKDFLISTFFENPVLQPGQSFTKDQVLHLQSMYNEYKERLEQKKVLMGQREAAEKQSSNAQNQSSGDQHQSSRDQYHSLNNQSSGLRQFASAIQQQTLSSAGIQKQSSSSGLQQQLNQLQSPILPMQSTSSQQLSMVQQQSYMVQQPPPIVQHRSTVQQQPMIQHSSLYNQLPVVNNFQQQRETSSAPTISKKMSEEMQNSFFRNYIHPSNGCSSGGSFTSSVSRSVDNKVQKEASCSVSKNSKVIAKTITHKDKQLKKDVAKMTKNKSKVELSEMTFESVKIENQTNFHDAQNKVNVPYNESLTKIIFTPPQKVLEAPKPYDSQVLSLPKNQISSSNCFMVPTKEDERCTKTVKSNKGKVYYSYKSKVSDEMLRESMYIDQEALKLLNEPKVMKIPKLPRQRTAQQKPVASPKKTRGPYKTGKNVKDRSTISNQTRQAHNELEKNRRANLRNHLEALKNILPPEVAASRPTTLTLLTKAKEFLVEIRDESSAMQNKKTNLCLINAELKMKIAFAKLNKSKRKSKSKKSKKAKKTDLLLPIMPTVSSDIIHSPDNIVPISSQIIPQNNTSLKRKHVEGSNNTLENFMEYSPSDKPIINTPYNCDIFNNGLITKIPLTYPYKNNGYTSVF